MLEINETEMLWLYKMPRKQTIYDNLRVELELSRYMIHFLDKIFENAYSN